MIIAMVFAHVWGVLELVALASLTRTIRVRTAFAALVVGLYSCSLTAILLQTTWTRLAAWLTGKYLLEMVRIASYTLDPFIEEFVKVLPLILLIWVIPSVRRQWSTTDCVLIGAASGAGFGLAENLFAFSGAVNRAVAVNGGWEVVRLMSVWQPTVPSFARSLTSWLPAAVGNWSPSPADHFNLHLEWSALTGLGVALVFLIRTKVSRVAGIVLWLYAAADHAATNLAVNGRSGSTLSVLAAPLDSLRAILCLMPAVALVIAWWLDRTRQRAACVPELALATELQSTSRIFGFLESALARPPWSILWVANLTRLRRAYATDSAIEPEAAKMLHQRAVTLRDRIDRLVSGVEPVVASGRGGLRAAYSTIRQPKVLIWVVLLLPSFAWLVVGGFPQTSWLQLALKTSLGWIVVRVISLAGLLWMGARLVFGVRSFSQVWAAPVSDVAAETTLRLVSGAGAFLLGTSTLILATTAGPDSGLLSNFHVLEQIAAARLIGTQLAALAALALFPPAVNGVYPITAALESEILGTGFGSSTGLCQDAEGAGFLRPQGDPTLVKTLEEEAGIRPVEGPVTLEAVFDSSGNQISSKPDDFSDITPKLLQIALDSVSIEAENAGRLAKGVATGAGLATGAVDAADGYYDQDPSKLIQSVLTTSVPIIAPEVAPILIAKEAVETGARLTGMSSQQIDAVEAQAMQDALGSFEAVSDTEAVRETSETLDKLFSGTEASAEPE